MIPNFRAWAKEHEVMCKVDGLDWHVKQVAVDELEKGLVTEFKWDEVELMQSTGRTGMNKKDDEVDIFQGDIIQVIEQGHQMGFYVENEYVGVIEYDKGHCGYFLKLIETNFHNEIPDEVDGITIFKGDEEPERYYFNDIDFLVPEDITILGNVYENPELVEELEE